MCVIGARAQSTDALQASERAASMPIRTPTNIRAKPPPLEQAKESFESYIHDPIDEEQRLTMSQLHIRREARHSMLRHAQAPPIDVTGPAQAGRRSNACIANPGEDPIESRPLLGQRPSPPP